MVVSGDDNKSNDMISVVFAQDSKSNKDGMFASFVNSAFSK